MGIIFVAGVHGVGKTTVCVQVAESLRIPHFSASGLIKAEKADAIAQNGKAVADVDGNQELLIRGVRRILGQHHGSIILDGHFTLLKPDGSVEAIPVDVFRSLHLDAIVVYRDESQKISERLNDRDNAHPNPDAIERHQLLELDQARLVATELSIPLKLLEAFDESGLVRLISERIAGEK